MSEQITPLDAAHMASEAAPQDETLRLKFFERLADAEMFVLLTAEAEGDQISPRLFPVDGTEFALAFDRAERLTGFTGRPAPYAAMSGRVLCEMLASANLGLGLNLEASPSSQLLEPDALRWLMQTLQVAPTEDEAQIAEIAPPSSLPEVLVTALDTKLALAEGLAKFAYLAEVKYENNVRAHLLAFVDALPDAPPALARAVNEALTFSGIEAGSLDVAFFKASDPLCAAFARHGLRFDLPQPEMPQVGGLNPGMNPDKPPKLR